jgi:hypothetical protein
LLFHFFLRKSLTILPVDRYSEPVSESAPGATRDVITDFRHTQHDRIDLSIIDANGAKAGDPPFTFRGTAGFTGAGQVRYVLQDHPGTANDTTMVYANVNASLAPDFQIEIKGLIHLVAGDSFL